MYKRCSEKMEYPDFDLEMSSFLIFNWYRWSNFNQFLVFFESFYFFKFLKIKTEEEDCSYWLDGSQGKHWVKKVLWISLERNDFQFFSVFTKGKKLLELLMMTVQVLLYSKAERGILLLDYYNVWVIEKVVWSKKNLSELCSKTKKQFNFFW